VVCRFVGCCGSGGHRTGVVGLFWLAVRTCQLEAGGRLCGAGVFFMGCGHRQAAIGGDGHSQSGHPTPNLSSLKKRKCLPEFLWLPLGS
jgi:hypothetical protein